MGRRKNKMTVARARACLATIDYDFSHFSIEGFAEWLGCRRGRHIFFVPRPMPATLFGVWLADDDSDYVFYDDDLVATCARLNRELTSRHNTAPVQQ